MAVTKKRKCVIVGGAPIGNYDRLRKYINEEDFVVYCDSGLDHMDGLGVDPDLIVGDFDSHDDPGMQVETITLPVAKDDTDTVFAAREAMRRGYREFLIIGAIGARLDHTLVNVYLLSLLENNGCHGTIVDDYSEMELLRGGGSPDETKEASIDDSFSYFSLVAVEGPVTGVTIRGAKFPLEDAEITPGCQYATSNEILPGQTAQVLVENGRLLLIKNF